MAFFRVRAGAGILLAAFAAVSLAQTPPLPLSATASDPVKLELMQGSPPPADKQITFQNGGQFPNLRWTLQHMRELVPSRNVWRGAGGAAELPRAERDWSGFAFEDDRGQRIGIDAYAERSYTDAIVVLHKGRVVLERYWTGMTPNTPHAVFSVTKSLTGVLASQLIAEGKLDPNAKVSSYLPELAGTAWDDATVQQTLDMTAGVKFREDYADPTSEVIQYAISSGLVPMPPTWSGPRDTITFLKTLKKEGEHGAGFAYKTVHSEIIGWLVHRVTGKPFSQNLSERVWSKMGAENDASINIDRLGFESMGSGFNATARDLARFGEMLRNDGQVGGVFSRQQLVSKAAVEMIRAGGDREKFKAGNQAARPGYSYRNQWWILHNADGAFEASGIHGQYIHVNPKAEVVIVRLGSTPAAANGPLHGLHMRAFQAIADTLR
ncbi:serine hydrolase domain-containing protein [Variovorax fucosicus]|uniref:serine hydrolase domain-containing protein n=1 Tax=Variovorax fucosicus TaxID=3053517 RepID=UPI00257635AE|nr:serine hydrolase [Variovorax sp. J22G47]MDM0055951.1 serine hydrolase [Variovorax sp. J22G47]